MPDSAKTPAFRRALGAGVLVLVAAVVIVGALEAWTFRNVIGPDGVSYLDIGDLYLRGHIGSAINAYWSPLYSIVVGAALAVVPASPTDEFAVAHAVNLIVYLGALAAFVFFLRQLEHYRDARLVAGGPGERLPRVALWAIGLVAFGWGVGRLIGAGIVTPDLLVAAVWFVAMGLLLRSLLDPANTRPLIALGAVLGIGYLAKTAMLPVALSFVAVIAATGSLRRGLSRAAVVLTVLLVVTVPFIAAISVKNDGATFGTSSQFNYVWYVHGRPPFAHLPRDRADPSLRHNPQKLLGDPPTFAFDKPHVGTFPLWFDPSYWYAGTKPSFDLSGQIVALRRDARIYVDMLQPLTGPALLAGFVALLALALRRRPNVGSAVRASRFLVPALFGVVMYAAVHVDSRFVGAFLATITVGAYALLPWPSAGRARTAAVATVVAVVAVGLWSNTRVPVVEATHGDPAVEAARRSAANDEEAARSLRRIGLGECRRVAVVASAADLVQTYLPRIAGMRIVAGVTRPPRGWEVSRALRAALLRARAALVVGRRVPPGARRSWLRLGSSDFFAYRGTLGALRASPVRLCGAQKETSRRGAS